MPCNGSCGLGSRASRACATSRCMGTRAVEEDKAEGKEEKRAGERGAPIRARHFDRQLDGIRSPRSTSRWGYRWECRWCKMSIRIEDLDVDIRISLAFCASAALGAPFELPSSPGSSFGRGTQFDLLLLGAVSTNLYTAQPFGGRNHRIDRRQPYRACRRAIPSPSGASDSGAIVVVPKRSTTRHLRQSAHERFASSYSVTRQTNVKGWQRQTRQKDPPSFRYR